jgi:dipeptidyl aminopeptidase/acylaminoacyl peptidase
MRFLKRALAGVLLVIGLAGPAMAAGPTPRMLVEITDLSGVSIAPDSTAVAYRTEQASVERNSYDSNWFIQSLEDATHPLRIADGGVPIRNGGLSRTDQPLWSPDSRWIYYRALHDGEIQVWRAARDGGGAERVTRDAADIEDFVLANDGQFLVYRVGASREDIRRAEEEEYDRGIRMDDSIFAGQGLFRSILVNGRLVSQRTDHGLLRQGLLWDRPKTYRTVDFATLDIRDANEAEIAALEMRNAIPSQAPAGTRLAVAGAGGVATLASRSTGSEVVILGADGTSIARCGSCRDLAIEGIAWRGASQLLFTARDRTRGYAQTLYTWDIARDRLRVVRASGGLLSGDRTGQGSTCAAAERFAVCVAAAAATPPELVRINLDNGEIRVLYRPNQALADATAADIEFLVWTDTKGRRFTGQLFVPRGRSRGERFPLFITYYLCPGYIRGGVGDEWPLASMAGSGIAALCVDGVMPARVNRDVVAEYDAGLDGVREIVGILDQRGLIDPARVGMGGLSFGSEITTWVASKSDLLAAASVSSTALTPAWYWFHALQAGWADNAMRQWGLGAPDETPDRWRALSPAYLAEPIRVPFLMQMSEEEYRSTMEYFVRMKQAGMPTEMWIFPHEPHQKFQPRHKLAVYERNLDWFRFWLQDYVDPDPLKAAQYQRWTELRTASRGHEAAAEDAGD